MTDPLYYKEYNRIYWILNKNYRDMKIKIWRLNNPEKRKIYDKTYHEKNRIRRNNYRLRKKIFDTLSR